MSVQIFMWVPITQSLSPFLGPLSLNGCPLQVSHDTQLPARYSNSVDCSWSLAGELEVLLPVYINCFSPETMGRGWSGEL